MSQLDKPIINVDVDGVLYDFTGAMRNEFVLQMGLAPDDMPEPITWRLQKAWPVTWKQLRSVMHEGIAKGRVFRRGDLFYGDDAHIALRHLMESGWHVRLVSAKTFDDEFVTYMARKNMLGWLYDNHIPHHTVAFSDRMGKSSYRADAIVDDKPTLEWAQIGADHFLFDQQWNRDVEIDPHNPYIHRARTLTEVAEHLTGGTRL